MRAVDTNVLIRLVTRDDPRQVTAAESYVARGAWVSTNCARAACSHVRARRDRHRCAMRCPSCNHDNRADRRFSVPSAAGHWSPTCSACGASIEPGEKFCGGCGAPLFGCQRDSRPQPRDSRVGDGRTPAAHGPLLRPRRLDGARSAARSRGLARGRARIRARRRAVERFGGHVAQYLGDGSSYFGLPAGARRRRGAGAARGLAAMVDGVARSTGRGGRTLSGAGRHPHGTRWSSAMGAARGARRLRRDAEHRRAGASGGGARHRGHQRGDAALVPGCSWSRSAGRTSSRACAEPMALIASCSRAGCGAASSRRPAGSRPSSVARPSWRRSSSAGSVRPTGRARTCSSSARPGSASRGSPTSSANGSRRRRTPGSSAAPARTPRARRSIR